MKYYLIVVPPSQDSLHYRCRDSFGIRLTGHISRARAWESRAEAESMMVQIRLGNGHSHDGMRIVDEDELAEIVEGIDRRKIQELLTR